MSVVMRAAVRGDLGALYRMAKIAGPGFTNLPPDRKTLQTKLEQAEVSFARDGDEIGDDRFLFMLEDTLSGKIIGTCQIFAQVGSVWPFYSYRIGTMSQYSRELDRTFRAQMLELCTDLDGSSEVGGLFLMPEARAGGIGKLLAQSRYLFIAMHRTRFARRTIAELRGSADELGNSPFWDGVAGRFFAGLSFREADEFNAIHGNQFIADLMPKHPIYTALIADSALNVIGVPNRSGKAAMRMLEGEGFAFKRYSDIFDGGPTMTVETDAIATIRAARRETVAAIMPDMQAGGAPDESPDGGAFGPAHLVAAGTMQHFRATFATVEKRDGGAVLNETASVALGVTPGMEITYVPR